MELEQGGEAKAEYGKQIIKRVSEELTAEFGKGFSYTNISNCRRFYLEFNQLPILQTPSEESLIGRNVTGILPWSHYERLLRIQDTEARTWYEREACEQTWSYRTLDRNISTQYYERMLLSQVKSPVEEEMKEKTALFQADKLEFIKNPTVLEFLGLPGNTGYKEKELETAILANLQQFMLEMGKGFALVGNQQLVRTDMGDFFIDLVFYNYILKCFVLIDLKVGRVTHQDVGQMDMYVRMYDELKRGEGDNPTIGIVLCSETSYDIAVTLY